MATEPPASQGQGPVDAEDSWVTASCLNTEKEAIRGCGSSLKYRAAPKAEPEDDVDVLEPEVHGTTPQGIPQLSTANIRQVAKGDSQECVVITQCTQGESQEKMADLEQASQKLSCQFQSQEKSEELVDLCEDAFLLPWSSSVLTPHESCETEVISGIEGGAGEWSGEAETISDPAEDIQSPDHGSQEWTMTPWLTEPHLRRANARSAEMMADDVTAEENITELNFRPDGTSICQTDNYLLQPAHHSPPDSQESDDINTVSSLPFADESEEEEEVIDTMSCQNQLSTTDISIETFQHIQSGNQTSDSARQTTPSAEQQEELLRQSQHELAPRGENQETAQQVLGQRSPPLSVVAMEPSNQGGAACHDSHCAVAVKGRHGRAGERTEGENEQTVGEEGQKHGELGGKESAEQQDSKGLLKDSQTAHTQELCQKKFTCGEGLKHSRDSRMENGSWGECQSDSGVSADFSPGSTMDGTPASISTETPIEREIRRSIERENSLRKSRGLPNATSDPQYIEIPKKAALTQSPTGKIDKCQDKDRELAGKTMRQEIYEETQREQDLVKLGKIPGIYDKGTVRQMKERKQIFEAFQTPSDSIGPSRSKTPSWSSASDVSNLDTQERMAWRTSPTKGSSMKSNYTSDIKSPTHNFNLGAGEGSRSSTPRGPGFTEGNGLQVVIIENNMDVPLDKWYNAKAVGTTVVDSGDPQTSPSSVRVEEEEEEEELTPPENPFFKLRSSTEFKVKVQQDIQETHEREKELRKQRRSLYGGRGGAKGGEEGGGWSNSMDGRSLTLSPSLNGLTAPYSPGSSSRVETDLSAARQSVGKLCVKPQAQAEDDRMNRPEVLLSPRSPRQKTPLVQLWESGQVNGHNEEDD